jgi:hypothetical protein
VSESGKLRHGNGAHGRGDRRRKGARVGYPLEEGQDAAWADLFQAINTLATVAPMVAPGARGELLSTKEMAERLGIAPKTLLKRKSRGQVTPALQLGRRGRAAIRWKGDEVAE